jgi:single-strand DNA-binding protein
VSLQLNRIMLAGNLVRDPEVRFYSNDKAVASFTIANNRRFKGADGEAKEEALFVDCEAWGRDAELIGQYLMKGRGIFIEGRLKLDTWEDKKDGSKRSKIKVVVERFQFLGDAKGDRQAGDAGEGGQDEPAPQAQPSRPRPAPAPAAADDEPPF